MTQQLHFLNALMDAGEDIIEDYEGEVSEIADRFADYIPEIIDDWELGVILMCARSLAQYAIRNDQMPEAVNVGKEEIAAEMMRPYFNTAWMYVSHTLFGDEQQLTYEFSK